MDLTFIKKCLVEHKHAFWNYFSPSEDIIERSLSDLPFNGTQFILEDSNVLCMFSIDNDGDIMFRCYIPDLNLEYFLYNLSSVDSLSRCYVHAHSGSYFFNFDSKKHTTKEYARKLIRMFGEEVHSESR
jgi:hypothetical protein